MRRFLGPALIGVILAVLITGPAEAADVGRVAALVDAVELRRNGEWTPLRLGDGVAVGDSVRTDDQGRVRLVFADGSVVVLSSGSEIAIDENVYDPDTGVATSVFDVLKGKIRAVVSDYYKTTGTFEVHTPNSVSGVRGTDFVVIHDAALGVSEIVGVSGRVEVRGVAVRGQSVFVTAREISRVDFGQAPSEPVTLSDERFRYYLEGLEFVGQGAPESMLFNQPGLIDGKVPDQERARAPQSGGRIGLDVDRIPGELGEIVPDAAGVAGQPADAVDSGDLGIRF